MTLGLVTYFSSRFNSTDASVYLPGKSTNGHYQIELDCNACHTPMMGVKEQACLNCHGADLEEIDDSHPKSKFTDPRKADQLKKIDARKCITCHIEHREHRTHAMGLTIPEDYCFHCHEEIGEERASHKNYPFNSCATAGCHNFHDNSALYEDFLAKHLDEPDFKADAFLASRNLDERLLKSEIAQFLNPEANQKADAPSQELALPPDEHENWFTTAHAKAGLNCSGCHEQESESGVSKWSQSVSFETCQTCHEPETTGWLKGKHGMRLAQDLSPMKPSMARLPMKANAAHQTLNCNSCHAAHDFDTTYAAAEACIQCHDDEHSTNYFSSPHFALWQEQQADATSKSIGVSCATCHLPRIESSTTGVFVQHNQNWNLEPNEKMIRSACLHCHGLGFAIDALADPDLIKSNFQGLPARHIESLDLVKKRTTENQD